MEVGLVKIRFFTVWNFRNSLYTRIMNNLTKNEIVNCLYLRLYVIIVITILGVGNLKYPAIMMMMMMLKQTFHDFVFFFFYDFSFRIKKLIWLLNIRLFLATTFRGNNNKFHDYTESYLNNFMK